MDRLEFGALVTILREDLRLTQAELAEKSGLDVAVISNVERGERRGLLKDGMLLKLATGLQLTTLERREFFFAASGVSEKEVFRPGDETEIVKFDPENQFQNIKDFVSCVQIPTFVIDSYCDVLLANQCAIEFYDFPQSLIVAANDAIGGHNTMRLLFHPESNFRRMVRNDWEVHALINLRSFRRRILRYRHKKYAVDLMREFLDNKKYPLFERYWRKMLFETSDEVGNSIYLSESGVGCVGQESFLATTPYGEIYLYQLVPIKKQATQLFQKIMASVGEGCVEFAPFPDKRKL